MKLIGARKVSVYTSWLMALVLMTTLLICHMAFGQVHQMGADHDSTASTTHTVSTEGVSHESVKILTSPTVADSFLVLLVAVVGMFASSKTGFFRTWHMATRLSSLSRTAAVSVAFRLRHQSVGPAFSGVFRL